MSTIKSSSENLTLNADGVGKDVVIQNNGTETVRVDGSGTVTATSLTVDTLTNQDTQLCKAWVTFTGSGTITLRDSFNVSGVVDIATGRYQVIFDTDMADTNYCVSIAAGDNSTAATRNGIIHVMATTDIKILTQNSSGTNSDADDVCVIVMAAQ